MAIKTTFTAIPELIAHFLLPGGNMEDAVTLVRFIHGEENIDQIGYAPFPLQDELAAGDVYENEWRDNEHGMVFDGTYEWDEEKDTWLLQRG